ncbi:putative protein-serine/threonine kinase [Lupinus albus]|uniref:Protein kinase domain-containing protein n=1 Tax=Lupinus albus TaxID=3870 RepID=A0A6A4PDY3_LUPAL|nr:putative protein-serine/threonine kinase [Lupinus albus]
MYLSFSSFLLHFFLFLHYSLLHPFLDSSLLSLLSSMAEDKETPTSIVNGNDSLTGHIISTTIGGKNGEPKQTISYMAERVVGTGSFGIVFQAS